MSKATKKRQSYNAGAIKALVDKHGFTAQYIRQCLRGDRNSITSDTIRKEYNALVKPLEKNINQFLKK